MTIRTYENIENGKGALIHNMYNYYLIQLFQFGEIKCEKRYKRLKKAQKEALKFIEK